MYCVYWIRKKDHTDIKTQGYVGVTSNFKERMRSHKKNKNKTPLVDAIKSYGWENLIVEKIYDGLTKEEALEKENHLRPKIMIGWNLQCGGFIGVERDWYDNSKNKEKHSNATSKATKLGIALKDTPKKRAERARKNWNSGNYEGISKGSKNPRAILNEEDVRKIKYELIPSGLRNKEIAEIYGVKHYVISFIRSGKNWSHI